MNTPHNINPDAPGHDSARHNAAQRDMAQPAREAEVLKSAQNEDRHDAPDRDTPRQDVPERSAASLSGAPIEDAPQDDMARQDAARRSAYTLSVDQVMQRLDVEGVSKARRTVQRYFQRGAIDAKRVSMRNGKHWLANELDMARFIEDLKRKEALALYSKQEAPVVTVQQPEAHIVTPEHAAPSSASDVLEERVEQLQERLVSSQSEVTYLRDQVKAANDHVKLWSDRASELKDLLEAQTQNNQPVLAAFAASLEAQARRQERHDAPERDTPPLMAR